MLTMALSLNAQELIQNGGFETWTNNNTVCENFEPHATQNYINHFISREAVNKKNGNYSIKHTSQSSTQYVEYIDLINVTPGHSYTISYWYLDNDNKARTRIWCTWFPATGPINNNTALPDHENVLRPGNDGFSQNSPEWKLKTITLTAPANAGRFRFQVRTYHENNNSGGFIYYDDFSFVNNTTSGVKDNNISGLKMFPNPVSGSILNIASDNNFDKKIIVFDVLGKQVLNAEVVNGTVNIEGLTAGVYIVKITEEGKTATRKLVVK